MNHRVRASAALLLGAWFVAWTGCRESDPVGDDRNLPPQTYLVEAPVYSQSGFYINHLFWDGFDPDGRVSYFEVTVTDSFGNLEDAVWRKTFKTDSLVRFPVGGESGQDQVLGNRFYVRAVDLIGRPDPEPAWIFFAARNGQFPEVVFNTANGWNPEFPDPASPTIFPLSEFRDESGNLICDFGFPPDTIPAGSQVEFVWTALDRDSLYGEQVGGITSFEYKLSSVDNTFLGGTLADTSAAYENLAPGTHSFIVRTFDDGGLAGQGCRYFQVNFDPRCAIERVMNSCSGEMVSAYRLSTRSVGSADPCGPDFTFDAWDPAAENLPELPVNPCLPAGYYAVNDTLPAGEDGQAWWFEVDASCFDPDGELADLETNYLDCRRARNGDLVCRASTWDCAARVESPSDTLLVIGPILPGDTKVVLAGIDDLDQRGAANADTVLFVMDFAPRLAHVDTLGENLPCNTFAGAIGDVIEVCDSDSSLLVSSVQSSGVLGTPCALATTFLDGSPAPFSARDFNSIPLPGETYDLEFVEIPGDDDTPSIYQAEMPIQVWLYDVDGTRRVEYIRWSADALPRPDTPFERITENQNPAQPGELTPACFNVLLTHTEPALQGVKHYVRLEIMDHQRSFDSDFPAAERVSVQNIEFFVNDIAGARHVLAGSK